MVAKAARPQDDINIRWLLDADLTLGNWGLLGGLVSRAAEGEAILRPLSIRVNKSTQIIEILCHS